jgi:hypothetical protein
MEERVVERSRQVADAAGAVATQRTANPTPRNPNRNDELRTQQEMDDEEERMSS